MRSVLGALGRWYSRLLDVRNSLWVRAAPVRGRRTGRRRVEIRRYGPRLAAETTVEATDAETGRSAAFRILAGYIFGANRSKSEIAMTSPVEVQANPQKVAMTAPVQTAPAGEGRYAMRFFLPANLTLATAPEPTDPRGPPLHRPGRNPCSPALHRLARGRAGRRRDRRAAGRPGGSAWRPAAEPVSLFYDPPWTLSFLRRNEAAVLVELR